MWELENVVSGIRIVYSGIRSVYSSRCVYRYLSLVGRIFFFGYIRCSRVFVKDVMLGEVRVLGFLLFIFLIVYIFGFRFLFI